MKQIVINLDLDTLNLSGKNPTAKINIGIDDQNFPELEWDDIVFAILSQWLVSAERLSKSISMRETFYFMDGSFSFEIVNKLGEHHMDLLHEGQVLKRLGPFNWILFYQSLKKKSKQAINSYKQSSMIENVDVANIEKNLSET